MFRCLNNLASSPVRFSGLLCIRSEVRSLRLSLAACAWLACSGCIQEMANQPRVDVMEPNPAFAEIPETRMPVPGTIARGQNIEINPFTTGRDGTEPIARIPVPVTSELLKQGQKSYGIFCQHCHGPAGSGDGMVVQRGFPAPPSYHTERIRSLPDGKIFLTITEGFGRMPALGARIPLEDRWAITAYVRALQVSQNTHLETLPENPEPSAHAAATH